MLVVLIGVGVSSGIEPDLVHELGVGAAIDQATFSGLLQCLAQQVTAQMRLVALTDGLRWCHDRQALVPCDVERIKVFVVEAIDGGQLRRRRR